MEVQNSMKAAVLALRKNKTAQFNKTTKKAIRPRMTSLEMNVLCDMLDHPVPSADNTCRRSNAQVGLDTAMTVSSMRSTCQRVVRRLETKGYLHRLSKDNEVLHCGFPPDVIENWRARPLDPEAYKIIRLYARSKGDALSEVESFSFRKLGVLVRRPAYEFTARGVDLKELTGLSEADKHVRAFKERGILYQDGSSYNGGRRGNTYRFLGIDEFIQIGRKFKRVVGRAELKNHLG
jgi:hypothetical protein